MIRVFRWLTFAVVALSLGACATSQSTTPRSRVAKDLGCSTEATGVRMLSANSANPDGAASPPPAGARSAPGEKTARWEVSGCGRTAIYVCTTPVRDCWREGEIRAQQPATVAPEAR